MKRVLKKLGKLFFYISYPVLIIALIASLAFLFVRTRELNDLNNTFAQAQSELNKENNTKQLTISDLTTQFQDLTSQVSNLRSENASLKDSLEKLQINGYGTITGKILPFVSGSVADFSQYQMVCAESTTNSNVQVCRTVSAVEQTFTLSVPAGVYRISAQIFPTPKPDSPLTGLKAYYTEYVKCLRTQAADKCKSDQTKPVDITIKAGDSLTNIDPIAWAKK